MANILVEVYCILVTSTLFTYDKHTKGISTSLTEPLPYIFSSSFIQLCVIEADHVTYEFVYINNSALVIYRVTISIAN